MERTRLHCCRRLAPGAAPAGTAYSRRRTLRLSGPSPAMVRSSTRQVFGRLPPLRPFQAASDWELFTTSTRVDHGGRQEKSLRSPGANNLLDASIFLTENITELLLLQDHVKPEFGHQTDFPRDHESLVRCNITAINWLSLCCKNQLGSPKASPKATSLFSTAKQHEKHDL